jgi:hypothetical protein
VILPLLIASTSLFFDKPVDRAGLHAQIAVGLGGGPNHEGLFGVVELGGTLPNGITLAALEVLLQNKGIIGPDRGPDLIGGSLLELKAPVGFPDLEAKIALGFGFVLDEVGRVLSPGFGLAYGIDLHVPVFASSGPTLGITVMHTFVPAHYLTAAAAVGYTWF